MGGTGETDGAVAPRRRVGRPRKAAAKGSDDPREDLLRAAAHLFATLGFSKATTRKIAEAAGLQQPSMFHYFKTKEDLLEALIDRTIAPQIKLVDSLDEFEAPGAMKLYVLVYADVLNICLAGRDVSRLVRMPELREPRFRPLLERRRALQERYRALIASAGEERLTDPADLDLATRLAFGLVESVGTWFSPGGEHSPERVAGTVADNVLETALGSARKVPRIRREASKIIADLDVIEAAQPFGD